MIEQGSPSNSTAETEHEDVGGVRLCSHREMRQEVLCGQVTLGGSIGFAVDAEDDRTVAFVPNTFNRDGRIRRVFIERNLGLFLPFLPVFGRGIDIARSENSRTD